MGQIKNLRRSSILRRFRYLNMLIKLLQNANPFLQPSVLALVNFALGLRSFCSASIPDCLLPLLMQFKDNGEVYVVSGRRKPVEPRTMQYRFAKILHNADLPSFHYHSLRHLFATRCVEFGFDVRRYSGLFLYLYLHIVQSTWIFQECVKH